MTVSFPSLAVPELATPSVSAATSTTGSFSSAIASAIGSVETAQSQANTAASDLLLRGKGDVHNVALAAQNAELSLELFQQVRNKFVSAYQEIMKMPM